MRKLLNLRAILVHRFLGIHLDECVCVNAMLIGFEGTWLFKELRVCVFLHEGKCFGIGHLISFSWLNFLVFFFWIIFQFGDFISGDTIVNRITTTFVLVVSSLPRCGLLIRRTCVQVFRWCLGSLVPINRWEATSPSPCLYSPGGTRVGLSPMIGGVWGFAVLCTTCIGAI